MSEPTSVLIPALNEERSIAKVVKEIPAEFCHQIIVIDNGSEDHTAIMAREAGAEVCLEPRRGYGQACLSGLQRLRPGTRVIVFLDGDYSDYPEELPSLTRPIYENRFELVLGSRSLITENLRYLRLHQLWGNRFTLFLMYILYGYRFSDLGPFRAISLSALEKLDMQDTSWGWNVEMQMKSARAGLRIHEVPVRCRERIGQSKISGTVRGSLAAGVKILYTVFKHKGLWRRACN